MLDAARHEVVHDSPVVLPGERLVLFSSQTTDPGDDRIESVSIDGGPRSVVVERARTPVWSPTGHLLFARDGAILAVAFDPGTGTPRGTATPVMPAGAIESLASGQMGLSLSSTGTLLSMPAGFTDTRVVSVGRDGAASALDLSHRAASGILGFRPTGAGCSSKAVNSSKRSIWRGARWPG